jgi:hypothetical protein
VIVTYARINRARRIHAALGAPTESGVVVDARTTLCGRVTRQAIWRDRLTLPGGTPAFAPYTLCPTCAHRAQAVR